MSDEKKEGAQSVILKKLTTLCCFGQQRVLICYLAVVQSRLNRVVVVCLQPLVVQKPVKLSLRDPISGGSGRALPRRSSLLRAASSSVRVCVVLAQVAESTRVLERLSIQPPVRPRP